MQLLLPLLLLVAVTVSVAVANDIVSVVAADVHSVTVAAAIANVDDSDIESVAHQEAEASAIETVPHQEAEASADSAYKAEDNASLMQALQDSKQQFQQLGATSRSWGLERDLAHHQC